MRRRQIFVADVLRLGLDPDFQRPGRSFGRRCVRRLLRLQQALIVLLRKLGVHRQIHGSRFAPPRQDDREFHPLGAARLGRHVGFELSRRQDLLQQRAQLNFAPCSPGLYVRQDFFKIADAGSQRLHLAQPLVNLFQPVAHHLK